MSSVPPDVAFLSGILLGMIVAVLLGLIEREEP